MRLFVGLPLGPSIKQSLGSIQTRYLAGSGLRIEPISKLHLTLLYIGEVASEVPYLEVLSKISFRKFPIKVDRVGTYDNAQTVYYAGIEHSAEASDLAQAILTAAQMVNPGLQYRFSPHITLARGKRGLPFGYEGPPVTETVETFILYESVRGSYLPKGIFPLT